ncbi:dihydropyrimidinase [Eubacterium multiforme]|uniref:Dihydropyrimidinase n=1 Tax=Eubacterium multiforme TaxID=83339 RepID=A0ABT9USX5_9FIRM|nr:dihydropyrimidinase [Eubacterium multiforme]MDQ0149437.1 dihydropyrimidinase [Eubacterium multiforme]
MGKILKGAYIVTDKKTFISDIRIDGEKIEAIGFSLEKEGDEIIDVSGSYILPSGIDAHTHFDLDYRNLKTSDDFKSGTKAAIKGGSTTIVDFVDCQKGQSLKDALERYKKKTKNKCYSDFGFHMTLPEWNERVSKEMEYVVKEGVTSFKMYMAYNGGLQVSEEEIKAALKKAKELKVLMLFHCEDGDCVTRNINKLKSEGKTAMKYHVVSRGDDVELKAVNTLIKISKEVDEPVYIVHLSSKVCLDAVKKARMDGAKIIVETCPHYLLLDKSVYESEKDNGYEASKFIMSPPLRNKSDNNALWNGINNGDINVISTDHCSFNYKDKKGEGPCDFSKVPNGVPGVEHRIELLYTYGVKRNKISLNKMVEVTSTNPSKIFGMYPMKGNIAVGSYADLIVIDDKKDEHITNENSIEEVDYTPYEGFKNNCNIRYVILRGEKLICNEKFLVKEPTGKYISRNKFDYERC